MDRSRARVGGETTCLLKASLVPTARPPRGNLGFTCSYFRYHLSPQLSLSLHSFRDPPPNTGSSWAMTVHRCCLILGKKRSNPSQKLPSYQNLSQTHGLNFLHLLPPRLQLETQLLSQLAIDGALLSKATH